MHILDLFAGIGGFSLSGHLQGFRTAAFVEINEFSQKVLSKNFPAVPTYNDVRNFGVKEWEEVKKYWKEVMHEEVNRFCLTGGFP